MICLGNICINILYKGDDGDDDNDDDDDDDDNNNNNNNAASWFNKMCRFNHIKPKYIHI
jgi:hypothetical protein